MSNDKVFVGDEGTVFTFETGVDISTSTLRTIRYKKPDGTTGTWAGSLSGTTQVTYTTQTDDIDQSGVWQFQLYVELPTWEGYGTIDTLEVFDVGW
jgi:hypothetical protein